MAMLIEFEGKRPRVADNVFIAPTAVLIGDVTVEAGASIWFGAVLRADYGPLIVGAGSSIQDNAVLHVDETRPTTIGRNVTVGHGVALEACHIGQSSVIGMNAVVLAGAEIGERVMVAAGSVVAEGARIPPRVLAAGSPAQVKKELSGAALDWIGRAAHDYHQTRDRYLDQRIDQLI